MGQIKTYCKSDMLSDLPEGKQRVLFSLKTIDIPPNWKQNLCSIYYSIKLNVPTTGNDTGLFIEIFTTARCSELLNLRWDIPINFLREQTSFVF